MIPCIKLELILNGSYFVVFFLDPCMEQTFPRIIIIKIILIIIIIIATLIIYF